MAIRAVVFDIGGVLEITPDLGLTEKWEQRLHLKPGELDEKMGSLWNDGSLFRTRPRPSLILRQCYTLIPLDSMCLMFQLFLMFHLFHLFPMFRLFSKQQGDSHVAFPSEDSRLAVV